jgi:glycosyltransferase involved in cell wall biosynthesis
MTLQKAGYTVSVVAMHEGELEEIELIENIPVRRIKLRTRQWFADSRGKALKYLEFFFKAFLSQRKGGFDIIHCNDLNALPISVALKVFSSKPLKIVYDCHEYQTEIKSMKGFKQTLARWLERKLIKYTDITLTVSNAIAEEYVRLYGVEKPRLVLNTPPYKQVEKSDVYRQKFKIDSKASIFLYQGGISAGRGIEVTLEAFKTLPDNLVIVFMGYGELTPLVEEAATQYQNIFYHPAVSPSVLLEHTAAADYGICFIDNICLNYYYCLPNKMFEFMMAGLPVIVSDLPEMKRIVEQYKVGLVADNSDPQALRDAVTSIHKLDKQETMANLEKVKKEFNWEQQEKTLLKAYSEVV